MANNPNVNKVVYGNQTVMDISDTTAEEGDVVTGKTFYKANGARSTGSAVIPDISNCYQTTDTAETDIADGDYFPFYDVSASGKRKSLWSNIKAKLQTFFDGIYRKNIIATFDAEGSSDAYCLLCTMVIQHVYIDGPTEIVIQERGRSTVARLNIVFQPASTYDPALSSFTVIGAQNNYYIVKTAASTWQIYVAKNEAYSFIDVIGCSVYGESIYDDESIRITWNMTNAASLPSGAVQANKVFASVDSPAFTGTPTAPTAAYSANNTQIATTQFVKTAIAGQDYKHIHYLQANSSLISNKKLRFPWTGYNEYIRPSSILIPVCEAKSDGTPYKFKSLKSYNSYDSEIGYYNGYAELELLDNSSAFPLNTYFYLIILNPYD